MKILGLNITKISGERKNPIKGKLEVKQNIDIKNIEKQEITISDKPGLKIDFEFSINYEPKIAEIEVKGSMLMLDEENKGKEMIKDWKKKKLSPEIKVPIYNYIIEKVSLKALALEDELGLPLHHAFPKIGSRPTEKGKPNYTG